MEQTRPGDDTYTGRFAPTPSGPLHFGSIVAALASYLDARHNSGKWLLRIEDIDTPRVRAGADRRIIDSLEILGLEWDGAIVYQSERLARYRQALTRLQDAELLYHCYCPRRITRGKPYPGACRGRVDPQPGPFSLRIKTPERPVCFHDAIRGDLTGRLSELTGDFILRRADGLIAYNLAVVVDDAAQGITHVVRGADLIDTTFNQVYLQTVLGLPTPGYAHHRLVLDDDGRKMSKQDGATDVLAGAKPEHVLLRALDFLGQTPQPDLSRAHKQEILAWAITHWDIDAAKGQACPD